MPSKFISLDPISIVYHLAIPKYCVHAIAAFKVMIARAHSSYIHTYIQVDEDTKIQFSAV